MSVQSDDGSDVSRTLFAVTHDGTEPYRSYWSMRRDTPIAPCEMPGANSGSERGYAAYRYEHVERVLRDHSTFSSRNIREALGPAMGRYPLVGLDEPLHGRSRSLISNAFHPTTVGRWERATQRVVNGLIDRFAGRGSAELVREFTFRFPLRVIAEILGLPPRDHARFHRWAIELISFPTRPYEAVRASGELRAYVARLVDERRRSPQDDLLSQLVETRVNGDHLGGEEIFSFVCLLLPAGAQTAHAATGSLLLGLLLHRDQLDAVLVDRSLLAQAAEETIRWEPPLMTAARVVLSDVELGGVVLTAGTQVVANLGSANHDESRWASPDSFDIFRERRQSIGFGAGIHTCLGVHLAKMEMRIAVDAVLDRCCGLRLDGTRPLPRVHGEMFRMPTGLPVRFTPS
jgi:cytochrome P450